MNLLLRSYFAGILVLVLATLSPADPYSPQLVRSDEIKWSLAELERLAPDASPPLGIYLEDLKRRMNEIAASADLLGKVDFVVEDLTVHNPLYWHAAFGLGEDRILLFWLHGLILAANDRPLDAFEWTVMARRGVLLSGAFDERWLAWEKELLLKTWAGDAYRRSAEEFSSLLPGRGEVVSARTQGGGRARLWTFFNPGLQVSNRLADQRDLFDHENLIWHRWYDRAMMGEVPAIVQEVAGERAGNWPDLPVFAADELVILAEWLAREEETALGLMCWLNATSHSRGPLRFSYDAYLAPLIGDQLREDLKSISRALSRVDLVVPWQDFVAEEPTVHPWLRWNARQANRRMAGYTGNLKLWAFDELWFYTTMTEHQFFLRNPEEMKRMINRIPRSRVGHTFREYQRIQAARLEDAPEDIARLLNRIAKRNHDQVREPRLYALAAIEMGQWEEGVRAFLVLAESEEVPPVRRDYHLFHAGVAAKLAGMDLSDRIQQALDGGMEAPWAQRLNQALLAAPDPSELLAAAQTYTETKTAAHLGEAYLALAFAPGVNAEDRRANLEAVISTGRVDYWEYTIASHALREMEAAASPR